MKKAIFIGAVVVCLLAGYAYAEMGDDMPGFDEPGSGMDDRGFGMEEPPGFNDPGFGMDNMGVSGADMADVRPLMSQMASMMKKVSKLLEKDLSPLDQKELSEITAEMSAEMTQMSKMMSRSGLSMGDIQDLQWRMKDTEERLNRLM